MWFAVPFSEVVSLFYSSHHQGLQIVHPLTGPSGDKNDVQS